MIVQNVTSANLLISDIKDPASPTAPLFLLPGVNKTLFNEDCERSAALKQLITDSKVSVIDAGAEPNDGTSVGDVDLTSKADKVAAVAAASSAATAVADAAVQTGAYVQADVQSIADLANDLKAKYNAMVTLVNELKTKMNSMND